MCPVTFIIDHVFIKEEAVTCISCYVLIDHVATKEEAVTLVSC